MSSSVRVQSDAIDRWSAQGEVEGDPAKRRCVDGKLFACGGREKKKQHVRCGGPSEGAKPECDRGRLGFWRTIIN